MKKKYLIILIALIAVISIVIYYNRGEPSKEVKEGILVQEVLTL